MYANKLLDAYKDEKRYVQDKQIAHDLNLTPQKISNIRNGIRHLSENEVIFIAEEIGLDTEEVLILLAADKSKNYKAQQAWKNIAKKFNGHGISLNTVAYVGIGSLTSLPLIEHFKYALCILC